MVVVAHTMKTHNQTVTKKVIWDANGEVPEKQKPRNENRRPNDTRGIGINALMKAFFGKNEISGTYNEELENTLRIYVR